MFKTRTAVLVLPNAAVNKKLESKKDLARFTICNLQILVKNDLRHFFGATYLNMLGIMVLIF